MSETNTTDTPAEPTASKLLSEAREAMGLSQEEVAQELFLIPNYIRWIDSNQIDKIDKQAFVRGYLRSYAKLVGLDGDDMVARFEKTQDAPPQKIEIRGVTQESVGSTNFTGPVFQTGVIGFLGLVVIIGLVWFFVSGEDETEIVVTQSPSAEFANSGGAQASGTLADNNGEVVNEGSEVGAAQFSDSGSDTLLNDAADAVRAAVPQNNSISTESNQQDAVSSGAPLPSTESLNSASAPNTSSITRGVEAQRADVSDTDASDASAEQAADDLADSNRPAAEITVERGEDIIRVDAGGSDELRFAFTDECWVEVEDAEGRSIYGDLNRNGDELVVRGIAPFEVLFGKAPAVSMTFNGEPFDLEPHTTAVDTAKVKVGS